MKKIIFLVVCMLITLFVTDLIYADNKTVVTTVDSFTESIKNNQYVLKTIVIVKKGWSYIQDGWVYVQDGWNSFKEWFSKLPGIKQYNESVYSGKNWKKTMNSMGDEYRPHLHKDAEGFKMLKEGKKKWDNL